MGPAWGKWLRPPAGQQYVVYRHACPGRLRPGSIRCTEAPYPVVNYPVVAYPVLSLAGVHSSTALQRPLPTKTDVIGGSQPLSTDSFDRVYYGLQQF